MDDLIQQFCTITEASPEVAQRYLEASGSNFETALELFFAENSVEQQPSTSQANKAEPEKNVRDPIPQKSDTLVAESFHASYEVQANALYSQSKTNNNSGSSTNAHKAEGDSKRKTLETLFRPPVELMHRGTFETAKREAVDNNRWLLVNVQNSEEFACQALNRDIWNHSLVRELVKSNFVLWQIYHDSADGRRFQTYYPVDNYPFIAIIDPRTGELLTVLRVVSDPVTFCDGVVYFLENRSDFGPYHNPKNNNDLLERPTTEMSSNKPSTKRPIYDANDWASDSNGPSSKKQSKLDESYDRLLNGSERNSTLETTQNEKWTDFCENTGSQIRIMFRLINNVKHVLVLSDRSKLKALLLYASNELGLPVEQYDFVLNFPTRVLNKEDPNKTLDELGFNKQEVLYVEER